MTVNKDKIRDMCKNGGYSQTPHDIWDIAGAEISIYARSIWAYLNSRHEKWNGSITNLSRNLGFSESTAKRAVDELERLNMITTTKTNKGTDFYLKPSNEWSISSERADRLGQREGPVRSERRADQVRESRPSAQREGAYKIPTRSKTSKIPEGGQGSIVGKRNMDSQEPNITNPEEMEQEGSLDLSWVDNDIHKYLPK